MQNYETNWKQHLRITKNNGIPNMLHHRTINLGGREELKMCRRR
jgi:hypothetical protein